MDFNNPDRECLGFGSGFTLKSDRDPFSHLFKVNLLPDFFSVLLVQFSCCPPGIARKLYFYFAFTRCFQHIFDISKSKIKKANFLY